VSVDTLLVTLMVALVPNVDSGGPLFVGIGSDQQTGQERRAEQERRAAEGARDPGACRYFVDPEARRKCVVRTNRAASGSAEPSSSFPEGTIWIAPEEPPMPPKLPPNTQR
jgi:hypothetical protein